MSNNEHEHLEKLLAANEDRIEQSIRRGEDDLASGKLYVMRFDSEVPSGE